MDGEYRKSAVYIGTIVEAAYYLPDAEEVPGLMKNFLEEMQIQKTNVQEIMEQIAKQHIQFEKIHPF